MTFIDIINKAAADYPQTEQPQPTTRPQCPRCRNYQDHDGLCADCQITTERCYEISQMAGSCRNGAERDGGRLWHVRRLVYGSANWNAVCGATPGPRSAGWSDWRPAGRVVTCQRCLKKLEATR